MTFESNETNTPKPGLTRSHDASGMIAAQLLERANKLALLIRGIDVAMLTTVGPQGSLHSRPMATLPPQDGFRGTLWFFTHFSGKTQSIETDEHVNLSYASPREDRYVSVAGRASVVRDPILAERLWTESLRTFFPQGPEDPDLVLLKVEVESAEYWDSPSSGVVKFLSMAKEVFHDYRHPAGENERIIVRTQ